MRHQILDLNKIYLAQLYLMKYLVVVICEVLSVQSESKAERLLTWKGGEKYKNPVLLEAGLFFWWWSLFWGLMFGLTSFEALPVQLDAWLAITVDEKVSKQMGHSELDVDLCMTVSIFSFELLNCTVCTIEIYNFNFKRFVYMMMYRVSRVG